MRGRSTKTFPGAVNADIDAVTELGWNASSVIVGTAGAIHLAYADGTDDVIAKTYDGQEIPAKGDLEIMKVLASGTSAQDITLVNSRYPR